MAIAYFFDLYYNNCIKRLLCFFNFIYNFACMEKEMDQKSLQEIKTQLLEQKDQLLKDLASLSRDDSHEADERSAAFPEYGDKPDENAQEISDYSTNIVTQRVLEKSLEDVEKSIKRIDEGKYGVCKYCQGNIATKRLMARPTATSCITCKTELQEND